MTKSPVFKRYQLPLPTSRWRRFSFKLLGGGDQEGGLTMFLCGIALVLLGSIASIICLCLRIGPNNGDEPSHAWQTAWFIIILAGIMLMRWMWRTLETCAISFDEEGKESRQISVDYWCTSRDYMTIKSLGKSPALEAATPVMQEATQIARIYRDLPNAGKLMEERKILMYATCSRSAASSTRCHPVRHSTWPIRLR